MIITIPHFHLVLLDNISPSVHPLLDNELITLESCQQSLNLENPNQLKQESLENLCRLVQQRLISKISVAVDVTPLPLQTIKKLLKLAKQYYCRSCGIVHTKKQIKLKKEDFFYFYQINND